MTSLLCLILQSEENSKSANTIQRIENELYKEIYLENIGNKINLYKNSECMISIPNENEIWFKDLTQLSISCDIKTKNLILKYTAFQINDSYTESYVKLEFNENYNSFKKEIRLEPFY